MISKFHLKILTRLLIVSISLGFFIYYLFENHHYLRSAYFFVFACIAIGELFWFIDRTNRDLVTFFESILESDFTTTFTKKNNSKSSERLYNSLNKITRKFREIGAEREAQYHLMEMMIQQVRIGIISFDAMENIRMVNRTFKELLHVTKIKHLDSLKSINYELYQTLKEMGPNENRQLKIQIDNQLLYLSILASIIKIHDVELKLITIQNIRSELEAGELEAWQKLIRVLAHEIMNSVTPITSLTDTLLDIAEKSKNKDEKHNQEEYTKKIHVGLTAIKNRSQALNRFTQAYQSLTRIPDPEFKTINAKEFVKNIREFLSAEIRSKSIQIDTTVNPADLQFLGDRDLLGQVVINLVKNAIDSLDRTEMKSQKALWIVVEKVTEDVNIIIGDNGSGIPNDQIDKIFVPFYTTRKEGSGIGLALAKQIVKLHNGTIKVDSIPYEATTFTIML